MQPAAACELPRGQYFTQTMNLRFRWTGDHDLLVSGDRIQLLAHFVDLAAEPLNGFDAQRPGRLDARLRHRRDRDTRLAQQLLEAARRGKQAHRIDALAVAFGLLAQFVGFNQRGPRTGRQVIDKMPG